MASSHSCTLTRARAHQVTVGVDAFRSFVQELDAIAARARSSLPLALENKGVISRPGTAENGTQGRRSASGARYGDTPSDPRRTLIERRLEAAEVLAKPFALRLEADGVSSVKVLARTPVRIWGFPESLVEQTERMLALLAARSCAAEYYGKKGSPDNSCVVILATNEGGNRGGQFSTRPARQQALFDPRFQRSALDPFGRPPRLERIQPCPVRHDSDGGDGVGSGTVDEGKDNSDELPSGVWDGQAQRAKHAPVATTELQLAQATNLTSMSAVSVTTEDSFSGHSYLAEEPPAPSGMTQVSRGQVEQCADTELAGIRQPLRFRSRALCHQQGTGDHKKNMIMLTKSKSGFVPASSSRDRQDRTTMISESICREPDCGATFSRACILRKHEQSHNIFPEYHRLKHAPQLFRDAPTAPCEGTGAPTARFRLRAELPPSVQKELVKLQRKSETRKRRSLLAVPGLPGAMATWAGVATPGRPAGEEVGGYCGFDGLE